MQLRKLLEQTGLPTQRWASLLGIDSELFTQILAGQRPVPPSVMRSLQGVLGVDPSTASAEAPAVWYKLKAAHPSENDLAVVALARRLGQNLSELESLKGEPQLGWKSVFPEALAAVKSESPFPEQGRAAAAAFRAVRTLNRGATGIGEALRGVLRRLGLLVLEVPMDGSRVEGLCFWLTPTSGPRRPCIVVNSYRSNWYRRNEVIAHELGHAIFDLSSQPALYDLEQTSGGKDEGFEARAEAFARELLLPANVLRSIAQRLAVDWTRLTPSALAALMQATQTEKRTILSVAESAGLISDSYAAEVNEFNPWQELKASDPHALTKREWARGFPKDQLPAFLSKRRVSMEQSGTAFLLPSAYIKDVVEVWSEGRISTGKAAQLLMLSEDELLDRFCDDAPALEDE